MHTASIFFRSVAGLCLLTGVAAAQVVEIISPDPNVCYANSTPLFTGGLAGGEAAIDLNNVDVGLRITNHDGGDQEVIFSVDGLELAPFFVQPADADTPIEVEFGLNAFDVPDADNVEISVLVRHAGGEGGGEDSINLRVDRSPPEVLFNLDQLAELEEGACFQQVPNIDFEVEDAQDDAPESAVREEEDGCQLSRIVRATDDCGNGIEVALNATRAPQAGEVTVELQGFVCGLEECDVRDPEAEQFQDGARVGRGALNFAIDGPANCAAEFVTEYSIDGEDAGLFQFDSPLEEPGLYEVNFTVNACGNEVDSDSLTFTILERPNADPGGPYEVEQGSPLTLDASGSTAAPELGGIVEYAWDVDNDGFYDQIAELRGGNWFNAETDEPIAEPAQIAFDTTRGDGDYEVQLRVTAGNGGIAFAIGSVVVTDVHPNCEVMGPAQGRAGDAIEFDGSNSTPGHETDPIVSYNWEFGDMRSPQAAANLTRAAHIYGSGGMFTVTLTVQDIDSERSCTTEIEIDGVGPIVEGVEAFNADRLLEGVPVVFSAGDTRPGNPFTPLEQFQWNFDDGPPPQPGQDRNPQHTYNDDGEYEVSLTVTDASGAEASQSIMITVNDLEPIIGLTGDRFGQEGETLFFDVCESQGSPADLLDRIEIDYGDGGDPVVVQPEDCQLEHVFQGSGEFTVVATAFDEDSSTTSEPLTVIIEDVVPQIDILVVYPNNAQSGLEGEAVTVDLSGSRAGSELDPIVNYRCQIGADGAAVEGDEPLLEFRFDDQGIFELRCTVTDMDGSEASQTTVATVENVAPTVQILAATLDPEEDLQAPFQVRVGQAVVFTADVDDVPGDLPPEKAEWDFGDGGEGADGVQVEHTFQAVGVYTVQVDIDDYDGTCRIGVPLQPGECDGGGNVNPACRCPELRPAVCDQREECTLIGGDASATVEIEVTPPPPTVSDIAPDPADTGGVIQGAEGEPLSIRIVIDAAQLEAGEEEGGARFDGPVVIGVPTLPRGASFEEEPTPERTIVTINWTPTFFDAGDYQIRVTMLGPFTETSRTLNIPVSIEERGTPYLVGAGGRAGRGLVTVYEYEQGGGALELAPRAQIDIGAGAGGLAVAGDGRTVFVATPGSGGVAAVHIGDESTFLRRVPTGNGTSGVAWSPGRVWATNALDNTVSVIDMMTLKVIDDVDPGVDRPTDIAFLPDGFDGIEGAHLAVVSARGGEIALLSADAAEDGENGSVASHRLGGVLTRVVADPTTGMLHIADGKTRRVYQVSAESIVAGAPDVCSAPTTFAARDLLAVDGTVWAATDGGLVRIEDCAVVETFEDVAAKALARVTDQVLSVPGIAAAVGDRIENFDEELDRVLGAAGTRMRRLAAFVSRQ